MTRENLESLDHDLADQAAARVTGLLLSDDMIFSSRITATARALGLSVKTAKTIEALLQLARRDAPRGVIVDLGYPGLAITDLIERLHGACAEKPNIVAFGSHVDAASLRAAREAGCDLVFPRRKFVEELPKALPAWIGCQAE